MTVVLSSSSPTASVAVFDAKGDLIAKDAAQAHMKASGTLLFLLDKCLQSVNAQMTDVRLFVADVGPGSFTGVKVCVTMAKSLAFACRVPVAGVSAFDLVDRERTVALPSKKGEWYVRTPGKDPTIETSVPDDGAVGVEPMAERAGPLVAKLQSMRPEQLVPLYVAEPSISKPRDPKILGGPRA